MILKRILYSRNTSFWQPFYTWFAQRFISFSMVSSPSKSFPYSRKTSSARKTSVSFQIRETRNSKSIRIHFKLKHNPPSKARSQFKRIVWLINDFVIGFLMKYFSFHYWIWYALAYMLSVCPLISSAPFA